MFALSSVSMLASQLQQVLGSLLSYKPGKELICWSVKPQVLIIVKFLAIVCIVGLKAVHDLSFLLITIRFVMMINLLLHDVLKY